MQGGEVNERMNIQLLAFLVSFAFAPTRLHTRMHARTLTSACLCPASGSHFENT